MLRHCGRDRSRPYKFDGVCCIMSEFCNTLIFHRHMSKQCLIGGHAMACPYKHRNILGVFSICLPSEEQLVVDDIEVATEFVAYGFEMAYELETKFFVEVAAVSIVSRDASYQ